jgi:hypothetical protein
MYKQPCRCCRRVWDDNIWINLQKDYGISRIAESNRHCGWIALIVNASNTKPATFADMRFQYL